MDEVKHYGVPGMRWKEHKMPRLEMPQAIAINNRPPIFAEKKIDGSVRFMKPARMISRAASVSSVVKKKKKKMKDVSKQSVSNGERIVSTMQSFMARPAPQKLQEHPVGVIPKLRVIKK